MAGKDPHVTVYYEYTSDDVALACSRYRMTTGKTYKDFWEHWIGLRWEHQSDFKPILRGAGKHKKMEILLNEHWYTLMKMWIAQNEET